MENMKRVYSLIIIATFCMSAVYAQSIFRGKVLKNEEAKMTYIVDENDNGILMMEEPAGGGVYMKTEVKGKDYSTKKLMFFEKDFSTMRIVEVRADGGNIIVHSDGYVIYEGMKCDKNTNPKVYDAFSPLISKLEEKLPEILSGQENKVKFQIAYIDDNKMLAPKPSCLERGQLSSSMEYLTFSIEDNVE